MWCTVIGKEEGEEEGGRKGRSIGGGGQTDRWTIARPLASPQLNSLIEQLTYWIYTAAPIKKVENC